MVSFITGLLYPKGEILQYPLKPGGSQSQFRCLVFDTFFLHRPKYRYPYYDENGRGKLLYGYGGQELYQYKAYSPLEGIHWRMPFVLVATTVKKLKQTEVIANFLHKLWNIIVYWITVIYKWSRVPVFTNLMMSNGLLFSNLEHNYFILNLNFAKHKYWKKLKIEYKRSRPHISNTKWRK